LDGTKDERFNGDLTAPEIEMRATHFRRLTGSLLAMCLVVGCGDHNSAPGKSESQAPPSSGTKTPSITATPNPVPAGDGFGTTKITWESGSGWAQVYISENGAPDTKMFGEGARGAAEAPWIKTGHTYEFRLYAGKDHAQLLDKVLVSRAK
jgi:hypothetical protein